MKSQIITILAYAATLVVALPNPWPAPTAAIEQREAEPMYCIVDAHGTRCIPDKAKRTDVAMPILDAREPKHRHDVSSSINAAITTTTTTTTTTASSIQNGCSAFVTGSQTVTRCQNTIPQCNTFTGTDGATTTACVLKRTAAPEPTLSARLAEPEPAPMECVTDAQGTRCIVDRRAVATPKPKAAGWSTTGDAICSVSASLTYCLNNVPRCTTYYDHDIATKWGCVL